MLKLNKQLAVLSFATIIIQIQLLLKLNRYGIYQIVNVGRNSNTTLVKVKFAQLRKIPLAYFNSNTTLVKVKYCLLNGIDLIYVNSNTTLVKVKSSTSSLTTSKSINSNTTLVKVKWTWQILRR